MPGRHEPPGHGDAHASLSEKLTPAGRALHRHAVAVLERLERAGEELAAIHHGLGGTLRVGAFTTANIDLVPGALKRFAGRCPEVELRMSEGLTSHLTARLRAGALDVAVISDYPAGLSVHDLRTVPLGADRLLVALPAGHRLAAGPDVDLRDLAGENWIEAAPRGRPTMLATACAAAGFTPRTGLRVAEWSGTFGFVAAGFGVTLVPELAARAVPSDVALKPLRGTAPVRRVYAALPASPLPAALALVEMLGQWRVCTAASPP
ncbi:DNA-binding transcriptional regulator, LysR family [Nonomuraea maritima]|uniref:DNA-binding transcriptional regulator, LysR family n=1 Tax=Nonomuraea maritima TaxID=683260 RepID=A0A1G8XT43_9ACTN|nr:LysR substrate-binding domain-containing protein [Nonomuraea maritima]SDJ93698.1 DNA-binding transcriptional regulator, LysR family [Nonomuraea maritima]